MNAPASNCHRVVRQRRITEGSRPLQQVLGGIQTNRGNYDLRAEKAPRGLFETDTRPGSAHLDA